MTPAQHKKRRPNREHRCGIGQIPSEGQVRTSHNFRVLERGKLCIPWFVRVVGFLQQQRVNLSSLNQKSFPYRSLLRHILLGPFLIGIPLGITKRGEQDISLYTQSWVASKLASESSAYLISFGLTDISLLMLSAFRHALRTPFIAPIQDIIR